ncbi:MAG: YihY family inner membrane protein [Campylobacterota bacterium]|nr:YihY family inner membrane protein [Campylobacterota bacterium]
MDANKFLRHAIFLLKHFISKEITFYASSLSFYTIFTIVPLLMIVLTLVTNMPGFDEHMINIKGFIFENLLPGNSESVSKYIDEFLKNSVKVGVTGFVSVIVASMLFFQNYEYIVSKIFRTKVRGIWDSITTYWTLLTLTPIALVASFFVSSKIQAFLDSYESIPAWFNFMAIFPFLIIWGLFFLIFKISANTKIYSISALITSFVIALSFAIAKMGFVYYVFYNNTYTTIYGSFAALLFFFFWIYVSWIIFAYGLKLCYMLNRFYLYRNHKKKREKSELLTKH